jgi:hypothetical protein
MNMDREQPLNPPGIDAPDRKIVRQYIPMREYDDIEANGQIFRCLAEVESCGNHDEDIRVFEVVTLYMAIHNVLQFVPIAFINPFIDSYISRTGPTWRELIEREICRQAALLPCTAWEVEYEGDE